MPFHTTGSTLIRLPGQPIPCTGPPPRSISEADYNNYLGESEDWFSTSRCGRSATNASIYFSNSRQIGPNHLNSANILFLDGHTASRVHWKNRDTTAYYGGDLETTVRNFTE